MHFKLIQEDLASTHLSSEEQDTLTKISYYWDEFSATEKLDCLMAILHPGSKDVVAYYVDELIEEFSKYPRGNVRYPERLAHWLWNRLDEGEQLKFVLQQEFYTVAEYEWMEDYLDNLAIYFKLDKKAKEWLHFNGFPLHVNDFYADFWTQFGQTIHEHLYAFLHSKNVHYIQELSLHAMFEFYDAHAGRAIY